MPVNINLLPDEVIARGITPPDIGNFGTALSATQDYLQKQAEQNLFSGGLPKDPRTGDIDWGKAGEMIARLKGVSGIPTAIPLLNLQEQRNLPPITSLASPQPPLQRPSPVPTSLGRPAGQATESQPIVAESDGQKLRPGDQGNLTGPDRQVVGVSVDGQPTEEPTTPFPARPIATVPAGSAGAMEVPRFAAAPTNAPPADRFADHPVSQQVAQAQAQRQPQPQGQIPGIPTQPQGNYTEAEAQRQDDIAARATESGRRADALGNKGMAEDYRSVATRAAAKASAIREGLIKTQGEQGKVQVEQEKAILDEGKKGYAAGTDIQFRLGLIDDNLKQLGPQWTGAGANKRAGFARAYNTTLNFIPDAIKSEFGVTPFDPAKIASWEDFNKQSLGLGFALARTLGAREAMQIVQQATASVPNVEQSYWGARLVSGAMRQAAEREIDYHKYLIQLKRSGNSLIDADVTFNQQHPVQSYVAKAISLVPPQKAIDFLQANPTPQNKQLFNKKYGDGATIGVFGPN